MNLMIISIVLIYFILQSYENVFFSVPFTEHFYSLSRIYVYRGKFFMNLKNLIRKVSLDFPEVPYKNILLKRKLIFFGERVNNTRRDHRYLQVQINGKSKYITLPSNNVVIEFVPYHGRKYFFCNRSPFNTYKEAKIYCELLEKYDSLRTQNKHLGVYSLASKIWRDVWRNCYYKCFSQNHFEELKKRLFIELGMLRTILHHSPIKYNKALEIIAQNHALRNAKKKKLFVYDDEKSKVHEVATFASPPLASVQMNKWYNEYIEEKTDFNKINKKESRQFYLLFSRRIKSVGIGAYLYRKKLTIVLTFI
ncbi:CAP domain-containing protein [Strongyloides ratti]|uniref:CAP domain-containing protein n=1 Tax=Strongyloides ratti TaxID=34506 RepID=A0A090MY53_STRRB|nr:CAP domain-containing protein [Strongyloides ratti]CEF66584.2 CAP domain-containing protein [Strongyloides ratti]